MKAPRGFKFKEDGFDPEEAGLMGAAEVVDSAVEFLPSGLLTKRRASLLSPAAIVCQFSAPWDEE